MQNHQRFATLALLALTLGATLCPSERLGLLLVSAYTSENRLAALEEKGRRIPERSPATGEA